MTKEFTFKIVVRISGDTDDSIEDQASELQGELEALTLEDVEVSQVELIS